MLKYIIALLLLPCGVGRRLFLSQSESVLQSSQTGKRDGQFAIPSFYHTQSEFSARLKQMVDLCKNVLSLEIIDAKLDIVVAVIKARASVQQRDKKTAFLLFGEHPREVISSETALEFINDLCLIKPANSEQSKRALALLEIFDIYVVPDANPSGRALVFGGAICDRTNANGVDINRNWGYQWVQTQSGSKEMFGGNEPFSEPETRALRDLMVRIKPYAFISIHSGALGLYTPPAYTLNPASDQTQLLDILSKVKQASTCKCSMGPIGQELGYVSHGNCLDYAHDVVHTPYAFAVEIYGTNNDASSHQYYHTKDVSTPRFQSANQDRNGLGVAVGSFSSLEKCFTYFNPLDEAEYRRTIAQWSATFMLMLCNTVGNDTC